MQRRVPHKVTWLTRMQSFVKLTGFPSSGTAIEMSPEEETNSLLHVNRGSGEHRQRHPKKEEGHEGQASMVQQIWQEVYAYFFGTKLTILLVFLPVALVSKFIGWGDGPTFIFSMLALTPLAERLGFVTEQLAMYSSEAIGGLINATFGNATEVILSGFALKQGLLRVVQLSLLGSVISNLLLVMGSAFIVGGIRHTTQSFNQQGASVNCGLLMLSVLAIMLPSLLSETHTSSQGSGRELLLSRFESCLLLGCYILFLVFQLCTHRHLYEDDDGSSDEGERDVEQLGGTGFGSLVVREETISGAVRPASSCSSVKGSDHNVPAPRLHELGKIGSFRSNASQEHDDIAGSYSSSVKDGHAVQMVRLSRSNTPLRREAAAAMLAEIEERASLPSGMPSRRTSSAAGNILPRSNGHVESESDDDEKELSWTGCFVWLTLSTVLIALLSEFIVDAIKGASEELGVPLPFLVTIVLPIVGNAAEHASALIFAYRRKMEIALGVAVGSSIQISVLVVPFCVLLAWALGQPMDLNFNEFESMVMFLTVLISVVTLQDGRSNWIKGVVLLLSYFMISAGFWCHKDTSLSITDVDGA